MLNVITLPLGVSALHIRDFSPFLGVKIVFFAFLGSYNSLQPTPLNGFLRKSMPKYVVLAKVVLFGVQVTTINT